MNARFGDLAGRGPIGLKPEKQDKAERKALRRISRKRQAYLNSPARTEGKRHMGRVAQLPCLICGRWPSEVHHEGKPRNDMRVLPLCPPHHRKEYGPGAYHYSSKAFYALHGSSEALLARVDELLRAYDDECLSGWF